jgi:hypothetical protein
LKGRRNYAVLLLIAANGRPAADAKHQYAFGKWIFGEFVLTEPRQRIDALAFLRCSEKKANMRRPRLCGPFSKTVLRRCQLLFQPCARKSELRVTYTSRIAARTRSLTAKKISFCSGTCVGRHNG